MGARRFDWPGGVRLAVVAIPAVLLALARPADAGSPTDAPRAAGVSGAEAGPGVIVERDTVEISPNPHVRIRTVEVDNRLGDVTVIGHDTREVALTVIKRAPDGETLERLKVNLLPDPSGSVRIGAAVLFGEEARPIPAGAVRIDITVAVPRTAHVDVKAWNGRVDVSGLRNGARLLANTADVEVKDVRGAVSATTAGGRQEMRSVAGAVSADSTLGELSFDQISGESLAARVHRGTVTATGIQSRSVTLRTTFGHILFRGELLAGGRYDIRAYRGDVEVALLRGGVRAEPRVRVQAYAREGAIESPVEWVDAASPEAGSGRLVGTFGRTRGAPAILHITSAVGDIRFGLVNQ